MPKYLKDLEFLYRLEQPSLYIQTIILRAHSQEHRCYIALLYLTGARPSELQRLRVGDCKVIGEELAITIPTTKRGFTRTVKFTLESPFLRTHVLPYISYVEASSQGEIGHENRLFLKDISTYKKMLYKVSDKTLTPYSFRHHRMTALAHLGANEQELKYWKGSKSTSSVEPYIHRSGIMIEKYKDKIK